MSFVALGIGALAAVGSMLNEADENEAMESRAAAFGVRKAGIDAATKSTIEGIFTQATELEDAAALTKSEIYRSQAQAEADARVSAAAAGVAGASVSAVINETEVNAVRADKQTETKLTASQNQLRLNFVNTVLNAEAQKGTLDTTVQDRSAQHAMAFSSGFLKS